MNFTFECGHTFAHSNCIIIAISDKNECPICKKRLSNHEGFYLSYHYDDETIDEFYTRQEKKEITFIPKLTCGECEGITKLGKKCTCSTIKNSKFCRFHR